MPFLKDQIELCEETGKFILPVSVDETASQKIYRKHPKSEKNIIKGMNSSGGERIVCYRGYAEYGIERRIHGCEYI